MSWSYRFPWGRKHKSKIVNGTEQGENQDAAAIVRALHEHTTDQQNARKENKERDKKEEKFWRDQIHEARNLNKITLGGSVVALGGLAVLGGTLWVTRESVIEANRAWVQPMAVTFDSERPPKVGQPISIILKYMNGGHDPALKVVYYSTSNAVDMPRGGPQNLRVGENLACWHATPTETGAAPAYAIPSSSYLYQSFIDAKYSTPDVFAGNKLLFTVGCIGYETFKQPHWAGYCSYLLPIKGKPFDQWQWQRCVDGHYAD